MKSIKSLGVTSVIATTLLCGTSIAQADLSIESWRVDDKALWESKIIPAFNAEHPSIKVKFAPTAPTEYNASLNTRLTGGTAGDLITCRPFDVSLDLFKKGRLDKLDSLEGMKNFPDVAKGAWQTDDKSTTYCLPMASVMHGFFYNKEIFQELGLSVPKTEAEFFAVLEAIKTKSKHTPISLGTNDGWETHQIVYTGVGPNYWKGEEGRQALIAGKAKMTDAEFTGPYEYMAKWKPYMSKGFKAQTYGDSQNLFALGRAAIYAAGSWDIGHFNKNADFEFGAFYPPVKKSGDTCYISDHTDIGVGINSASKNKGDAKVFLNWLASAKFASLYSNEVTGFFSLSNHDITIKDKVANEMLGWRKDCKSTIRLNAQVLNRGKKDLETSFWNAGSGALSGTMSGAEAAKSIQDKLDK